MTRQMVRAALAGFFLFGIACSHPTQPTGAAPAVLSNAVGEPSLQLAIDPNPLHVGMAMMRNGTTMYPVMWSMMVTERSGAPASIDGWECELRAEDGTMVFTGHFEAMHKDMHGHSMWTMMDQVAYMPDPARFGHGTLMVKMHAHGPSGRPMELSATARVE